jgi:hypothetical protein
MIVLSVVTCPPAMAFLADNWADRVIILLGELGLLYPAIGSLWQAEQMEGDDT